MTQKAPNQKYTILNKQFYRVSVASGKMYDLILNTHNRKLS